MQSSNNNRNTNAHFSFRRRTVDLVMFSQICSCLFSLSLSPPPPSLFLSKLQKELHMEVVVMEWNGVEEYRKLSHIANCSYICKQGWLGYFEMSLWLYWCFVCATNETAGQPLMKMSLQTILKTNEKSLTSSTVHRFWFFVWYFVWP